MLLVVVDFAAKAPTILYSLWGNLGNCNLKLIVIVSAREKYFYKHIVSINSTYFKMAIEF